MKRIIISFLILLSLLSYSKLWAQDNRAQFPSFMTKSYFEVNIGYINYPFSAKQLEAGYTVDKITVPHAAVRIILLGYNFNNYLSAQVSYMRPVLWVRYNDINGDKENHPVFMNIGGLTLKGQLPIGSKFKVYAEAGLGVITRSGFYKDGALIVRNANYATTLFGAGLKYQLNSKWGFMLSTAYSPDNLSANQPRITFIAGGFSFSMIPVSQQEIEEKAKSNYTFPHNLIQIGYSTNAFGYEVNNFVSEGAIPIFWGGVARVKRGITIHYERNIFHGRKVFALDWGTSLSFWQSDKKRTKFFTFSVFPLFRFNLVRTKAIDFYLNYSLAGPTFISALKIDDVETGPHFTFQDFMGMGCYLGENRNINAEIRIAHYSNGNLSPFNKGVKIPLTFNLGYAF